MEGGKKGEGRGREGGRVKGGKKGEVGKKGVPLSNNILSQASNTVQ